MYRITISEKYLIGTCSDALLALCTGNPPVMRSFEHFWVKIQIYFIFLLTSLLTNVAGYFKHLAQGYVPCMWYCGVLSWMYFTIGTYGKICHICTDKKQIANLIILTSLLATYGAVNDDKVISLTHDGVIKWKHFPRYWPFSPGIHRWIPRTKAIDTELWCFLWSAPE